MMTKFLVAAAALMLAQPTLAQASDALSATNPESADGFDTLRSCEASLKAPANTAKAGVVAARGEDQISSGSIYNRARGHVSTCEEVGREYLIVVRPAGSRS